MFDSESVKCSSVLLVTAHPDDEVMFFAPTIHQLQQQGSTIHILCLSNGNGAGLGLIRENELFAAAGILKIPVSQVVVINHPSLQDGMQTHWPPDIIAQQVEQQLVKMPCDMVLTFDGKGVSGHINHCCVHDGVSACDKFFTETRAARGMWWETVLQSEGDGCTPQSVCVVQEVICPAFQLYVRQQVAEAASWLTMDIREHPAC